MTWLEEAVDELFMERLPEILKDFAVKLTYNARVVVRVSYFTTKLLIREKS